MPPVFPEVHGDTVGAGLLGQERRFHRIRHVDPARLPDRRHMIDIDA
jgi:hypothetical protein